MKFVIQKFFFLFFMSVSIFPQSWQQTAGTPEGSGVTDMLVRKSNQHIFVTTGSFNWPNGDMGGVRRSADDGATWENLNDVFVARTIIDAPDGNLYASIWPFPSPEGLYRSTDNGDNWGNPLVTVPTGDNIFSIAVNTLTTPNTIFAGTRNGPLRSTDNGVNWAPAINGIPSNSWVRDIEVDSGGYVAAATTNGLFISTNNGDLWEQATGVTDTVVKLIFDYPANTDNSGSDTRLLAGTDDGSILEAFSQNRYLTATLLAIFDGGEISGIWIGYLENENKKVHGFARFPKNNQGGGFNKSSDNGMSWQQKNDGLPNLNTSALSGIELTEGVRFYTGLFDNTNGGARIFNLNYTLLDIEPVSFLVPDEFELLQNYPNPFNPSTTLQFSVPKTSSVLLEVYNSLGENVAILVSQELTTGNYTFNWDASFLPSGVYFYRLQAVTTGRQVGDFIQTKKMILVK